MKTTPNEVVRMFLEHMTPRQRVSVARVCKIWCFLTNTFGPVKRPVIVITTEKDKNETQWRENKEAMTEKEFEELVKNDCPEQVLLQYPMNNPNLLNNPLINIIGLNRAKSRAWDEKVPMKFLRSVFQKSKTKIEMLLESLSKKSNDWSLHINSAAVYQIVHAYFDRWPYLKEIHFYENFTSNNRFLRITYNYDYFKSIQTSTISFLQKEQGSIRFKTVETKIKNYNPIDMITQLEQTNPDVSKIEFDDYKLNYSQVEKLVRAFESNNKLEMISFPKTNLITINQIELLSLKNEAKNNGVYIDNENGHDSCVILRDLSKQ